MLSQLRSHPTLIQTVVKYERRLKMSVEQFKAVVELSDGSYLHINEVWVDGELEKYAYYWLTPTDTVIQGWDNAPHHPRISTYPHHTHTKTGVDTSQIHSLFDVLDLLKNTIGNE